MPPAKLRKNVPTIMDRALTKTLANRVGLFFSIMLLLAVIILNKDTETLRSKGLRDIIGCNCEDCNSSLLSLPRKEKEEEEEEEEEDWISWINSTLIINKGNGIKFTRIEGDPAECIDVIYTGDTRDPFVDSESQAQQQRRRRQQQKPFFGEGWKAMIHVVRKSKALNRTCLVFFQIPTPFFPDDDNNGQQIEFHPVWGRVLATALAMMRFPQANYFLYLDSDALIAYSDVTPTKMYRALTFDGFAENATYEFKEPGLIVNKPYLGYPCLLCERLGLGSGCINSGVLLWKRSKAALSVLEAWWDSRLHNQSQNFFEPLQGSSSNNNNGNDLVPFHGWGRPSMTERVKDNMSEQNRLNYIYGTNKSVRDAIWIVPRQRSDPPRNSTSCPIGVYGHTPCLQQDFDHDKDNWQVFDRVDRSRSCFVNHFTETKKKISKKVSPLLFQYQG